MTEIKERNYLYDSVRGLCMFLIVLQHFTFKGGYQFTDNAGNLIYVGIDIFVMQCFFFLSGLFSKNPDKNREKLFKALLWPVIIVGIFFWAIMIWYFGWNQAVEYFRRGSIPYAMWFLIVLFIYRYFQKYYVNMKHLFIFALVLYFVSGIFEPLSTRGFTVSRMCTFFISFVIGYLMTTEQVEKLRRLKIWQTALLGLVLIGITYVAVCHIPLNIADAVKLYSSFSRDGLTVYQGLLIRGCLLIVSSGWIVFLLNIFSGRKGFWAHVGMHTMPVYIFHLFFAGLFRLKGFTFGLYDFESHEALYIVVLVIVSLAFTALLSTKPFQKAYLLLMEGTYAFFTMLRKGITLPIIRRLESKRI